MRTLKLLFVLALAAFFMGSAVSQAATTTVVATADTSVDESTPSTNYGSGLLRIDGSPNRWALLQFNVPSLTGSTVTDAHLRIYKQVGSPSQTWDVQAVPCSTWTWNTVTWNTRPTLGAKVGSSAGYPSPGAGWADATLAPSAISSGSVCLAVTKPTASDVWISADDLNAAHPAQLVLTTQVTPPPSPADEDKDGVPDSADKCAGTPAGTTVDSSGCPVVTPPPPPPSGDVAKCGGTPVAATPSTLSSVIASRNSVTIDAAPGTYSSLSMRKSTSDSCVEIRCTATAKGASYPAYNSSGCLVSGESTIESIKNLTIEGFVIRTTGAETYGLALYDESPHVGMNTRIANNVFADSTDHDISTKERNNYTEVVDNWFADCRRHCWEIGQNGNIRTRPSTTTTSVFKGNTLKSTTGNGITQRYNLTLNVDGNDFRGFAGRAIMTWPFWAKYPYGSSGDDGSLYVPGTQTTSDPKVPLRTNVTNNTFSGKADLLFEGRGVNDDRVLLTGNTGSLSCSRSSMDYWNSGTAAAHINEETTGAPVLDPASTIACPVVG